MTNLHKFIQHICARINKNIHPCFYSQTPPIVWCWSINDTDVFPSPSPFSATTQTLFERIRWVGQQQGMMITVMIGSVQSPKMVLELWHTISHNKHFEEFFGGILRRCMVPKNIFFLLKWTPPSFLPLKTTILGHCITLKSIWEHHCSGLASK